MPKVLSPESFNEADYIDWWSHTNLIAVQLYHLPNACYLVFHNSTREPISSRDKELLRKHIHYYNGAQVTMMEPNKYIRQIKLSTSSYDIPLKPPSLHPVA